MYIRGMIVCSSGFFFNIPEIASMGVGKRLVDWLIGAFFVISQVVTSSRM